MLEYIRKNEVKDVLFDKVDRACRGYRAAYLVEELISDHGVKFHFIRDHLTIDRHSPMSDRDRFGIGVWMGKRYSENLRMEVIKGLEERRRQGHWNHKAPVGYLNVRKGKRSGIEVDKDLAPAIKEIFELYSTGNYTQKELKKYLEERLPEKKITKGIVEITLLNPFYYGAMRCKGKVIKGTHTPLISKELWDNCQRVRGIRACKFKRNEEKSKTKKPFMGLFRCGECFSMVSGEVQIKPNGKKYIYYHCGNPKCPEKRKNTRQEHLMEELAESFKPFSELTPQAIERFLEAMEKSKMNFDPMDGESNKLLEKKRDLFQGIEKLEGLYKKGLLNKEERQSLIQIKEKNLRDLEFQAIDSGSAYLEKQKKVFELIGKSYDFMRLSENGRAKARLVKIVLSNRRLKDRRIEYSYEKPFENLVKNLTVPTWSG